MILVKVFMFFLISSLIAHGYELYKRKTIQNFIFTMWCTFVLRLLGLPTLEVYENTEFKGDDVYTSVIVLGESRSLFSRVKNFLRKIFLPWQIMPLSKVSSGAVVPSPMMTSVVDCPYPHWPHWWPPRWPPVWPPVFYMNLDDNSNVTEEIVSDDRADVADFVKRVDVVSEVLAESVKKAQSDGSDDVTLPNRSAITMAEATRAQDGIKRMKAFVARAVRAPGAGSGGAQLKVKITIKIDKWVTITIEW